MEIVTQRFSSTGDAASTEDRISIGIEALLESRLNFEIIGSAGAGKTTLLRVIGYEEARRKSGRLPVFAPLIALGGRQALPGFIRACLERDGLPLGQGTVDRLLKAGNILVLLDGVDEVAGRMEHIVDDITGFIDDNPNTQVIIATRPWAAIRNRERLFPARLLPFTEDQVQAFFLKWFADEPRHAREIQAHIKQQPDLYGVMSTPLVATIFAVVKRVGGKLPSWHCHVDG